METTQATSARPALNPHKLLALKQLNFDAFRYTPQVAQWPVHASSASLLILSGGEGSGKSKTTSAELAARYPSWRRALFVAYKSESAHNEADYLFEFLNTFGAVAAYRKPRAGNIELVTRDGAVAESVTTHAEGERAVSGTGKTYDIIAMLEAGKQSYAVFLACLLRISRTGGLLILSGTIEKSEPWFPDLIRKLREDAARRETMNAEIVIMPTWENRLLYPGGRSDPKILLLEKELTPELFAERLGGEPSPPEGLVLREFSYLTHVFEWVQYDPTRPVLVAVDPGYSGSHYSVNFIQEHPRAYTRQFYPELPDASLTDVFVIGDLYLSYTTHEEVIVLAKELPWWDHVTEGIGDVVMKTHPMADRAPVDVWQEKAGIWLRGQPVGIDDGVDRHRTFLKDPATKMPRIFFNPACTGPREYGLWKRKLIAEDLWGAPDDKNCDFAKAINYYLIDRFGRVERRTSPKAQAVGERVTMDRQSQQLPAPLGEKRPTPARPAAPAGKARSSSYVVIPRKERKPI